MNSLMIASEPVANEWAKDLVNFVGAIEKCTDVPVMSEARASKGNFLGSVASHASPFSIGRSDLFWLPSWFIKRSIQCSQALHPKGT